MKSFITPAIVLTATAAAAITPMAVRLPDDIDSRPAPVEAISAPMRHKAPAAGTLAVDFTVAGATSAEPAAAFDFNAGLQGWTCDPTEYVKWSLKKGTGNLDFTAIDAADAGSLYVEGPYRVYQREKSAAVSPAIAVPAQAMLDFYVGCSLNYEDQCSLTLEVSADDFDTATALWCSRDEKGEKPLSWRHVSVSLADWAGKTVKLRFTYGAGTGDTFGTGGYNGYYYIDALTVSGAAAVESVDLVTGERITLQALGLPEGCTYEWTMPGAVPATSTEAEPTVYYTTDGTYDITLTATAPSGESGSRTRAAFVKVTGTAPTARIVPPATFRLNTTRLPLVCPSVPVTYTHDHAGFPAAAEWTITGTDPADGTAATTVAGHEATVRHHFLHNQLATMTASNAHGTTADMAEVSVEYKGLATNMRPGETLTYFDMEDWGVFPGSNTQKITAYAEYFSRPSHPIVVDGVYAFFLQALADNITDQIASVGVHIYTVGADGLPGTCLDSWWWQVSDLDTPSATQAVGTPFPLSKPLLIDEPFFIVVDGLPVYTEAKSAVDNQEATTGTCVTLGMAPFRAEGGITLMKKDDKWINIADYFPAGANHTSLAVMPSVCHSVVETNPIGIEEVTVGPEAGTTAIGIFSMYGWKAPVAASESWLRVTNEPGDLTVDELQVACEALPAGMSQRSAVLTVTDGFTSRDITVTQRSSAGIGSIEADGDARRAIYDLQGRRYSPQAPLAPGVYIIDGVKTTL